MDTKTYGPEFIRDLIEETPTTRELLQQALEALYDTREIDEPASGLMNRIRSHLAKPEPAWLTDIVGYGQFVDGKLVTCSQTEINVAIGSKNIECRPLYSVKEMTK